MTKEIEVIARYREADADERLSLYLQFADLRVTFQEIDLEEYSGNRDSVGIFDQAA